METIWKAASIQIKSMVISADERNVIFGVGSDNKVYIWSPADIKWRLYNDV